MGQVYKVRSVITERVEAMKVLLPDLVNQPELAERFLREIRVQARLEHPSNRAPNTVWYATPLLAVCCHTEPRSNPIQINRIDLSRSIARAGGRR